MDVGQMPWRYTTAEGERAFYVCRWDTADGGKVIRPLSWFPDQGWRFGHWPCPRPLYRIQKITAAPRARIVICEGEKAAGAAARVFRKMIATTSVGGAQAASKTDWSPLAGRRVLIWPDNDDPGRKYAREVATILAELDCDVSIIDAAALAALDPEGGAQEPARGYDAADAVAEWADLAALGSAATRLAKRFDPGPAFLSFPPYTMEARGLTIEVGRGRGKQRQTDSLRVAASFEVLGASRDPRGAGWGKALRWRDGDGRVHVQHVADAAVQGEPGMLCGRLADQGLQINRAHQRALVGYLCAVETKRRLTLVTRTGWHEVAGRPVFVLPNETIGPPGESVILDGAANGGYERRGTLEDWRRGVAKLASGHVLPVLMISTALAGALLYLTAIEGGGVHVYGPSSIGKSTLMALAASVWGRGDVHGYVRTWRATANGLEGAAALATDTVLILDELGQVHPREIGYALYTLAGGAGKSRAARDGSLRETRSWRVITISSGEIAVDAKLTEDRGRKPRAGQLIRMLGIAAAGEFGVFDSAGPGNDAAALARACKLAARSAYGTAGPEFVRRLNADGVTGDEVRGMVDDFVAAHVSRDADGQVDRAAQCFGLFAAAGKLATEFRMTDWREDEAREAAAWALQQWVEARGGSDPAEDRQAIEQVRLFIETHGAARFDDLNNRDARPALNRAGWRKGAGEDQRWLIPPEIWKVEVCAGLDAKLVARALASRGMLEKGGDGNSKVEKIDGVSHRVYVVTPRIFDRAGA